MNRAGPSTRLKDSLKRQTRAPPSNIPKKKRKKRVKNIKDSITGEVKYVARKPTKYRAFQKYYSQSKPSHSDIKAEMRRVKKCAHEVMEETEKMDEKNRENMKKDVEPIKVDDKYIKPFVFTGPERISFAPPARNCEVEIPRMLYFEPLTDNVEAKEETQLSHIPVIDDNQHDNSIINHLVDKFPSGIHGLIVNDIEMSEEQLYKTMKKLLPETTNPDLLYYALYQIFNNSGSQKDFSVMFPRLHRVYGDGQDLNLEPWKTHQKKKLREKELVFGPKNHKPLGVGKKVYVKSSAIAGNGLFLGEDVGANEYIGEYVGEHCHWDEVKRRESLARLSISYAYDLPEESGQTIDSGLAGNVFRFINDLENSNCQAIHKGPRIAIYSKEAIKAGTELTLSYNYSESMNRLYFRSRPEDRVPLRKPSEKAQKVKEEKKSPGK